MNSEMQWNWGQEFIGLVILSFILLQLCGSVLVIFGRQSELIPLGCQMLVAHVIFTILAFPFAWGPFFIIR